MGRQWLLIALLALAGGIAGVLAGRWLGDSGPALQPEGPDTKQAIAAGDTRPEFELPGLDGNAHHVSQWDGKVVLLNFWATWCAPCREEMPMLNRMQAEYGERGFQVVGIALDSPASVQSFAEKLGIDYPILIDNATGDDLMRRYGNTHGVLPYSVLIGRDGTIKQILLGALHRDDLLPLVRTQL